MPQMVIMVVHDPGKIDGVLRVWDESGVAGLTILDSSGVTHGNEQRGFRDDLPLFPSLRGLLRSEEETSRTLFSVIPDDFNLDGLIAATEELVGKLDDPYTGILFVVPVTRVAGLRTSWRD